MHELFGLAGDVVYAKTSMKPLTEFRRDKWDAMPVVHFPGPLDVERELKAANEEINRLTECLRSSAKRVTELGFENAKLQEGLTLTNEALKAKIRETTPEKEQDRLDKAFEEETSTLDDQIQGLKQGKAGSNRGKPAQTGESRLKQGEAG